MNEDLIIQTYKQLDSIRGTAFKLDISNTKVKKVLISHGLYESDRSREIAELRKQGMSYQQVADTLGISPTCVYANTPYEKGMYDSDTPTINALRIRKHKEKKKQL